MFPSRMRREARALAAEMRQKARLEADKMMIEAQKRLDDKFLRDMNTPEYNLFLYYRKNHTPNSLAPDITWDIYDYLTPEEKILLAPDVPEYAMKIPEKKFKDVILGSESTDTESELMAS